jgi:hypothetical protein
MVLFTRVFVCLLKNPYHLGTCTELFTGEVIADICYKITGWGGRGAGEIMLADG